MVLERLGWSAYVQICVQNPATEQGSAPPFLAEEFCSAQVIYGGSFEVEFMNSLHQCPGAPVCQNVEKLDETGGICRPSSTLYILRFIDHLKKSKNMSQIEGYCWGLAPCWFLISGFFALLGRTSMIMQYSNYWNPTVPWKCCNLYNATVMYLAAKPKPPPRPKHRWYKAVAIRGSTSAYGAMFGPWQLQNRAPSQPAAPGLQI